MLWSVRLVSVITCWCWKLLENPYVKKGYVAQPPPDSRANLDGHDFLESIGMLGLWGFFWGEEVVDFTDFTHGW